MKNSELEGKLINCFEGWRTSGDSFTEFLEFFQIETYTPEHFITINNKSYVKYRVQVLIETYEKNHFLAYQKNFFNSHLEKISEKEGVSIDFLLKELKHYQISDFLILDDSLILVSEVIRVLSEFDML